MANSPASRRRKFLSNLGWLVAGALLGSFFAVPLSQATDWVSWHWRARSLLGKPTCDDPGWYRPVSQVDAAAYHEYREKADPTFIYTAGNTTDGDRRSAWVAPMTAPTQNWISWDLARSRQLSLICLRPGFTRDYRTLAENGRPRDALLTGCGDEPRKVHFDEHVDLVHKTTTKGFEYSDWFAIPVDCNSDGVKLSVQSTYPAGDGSHLVAISDARFYGGFALSQQ